MFAHFYTKFDGEFEYQVNATLLEKRDKATIGEIHSN